MDLFLYNPTYQVWICTAPRCQYAVSPRTLLGHLRTRHRSHPTVATPALCQAVLTEMLQRPWADPSQGPCPQPSTGDPPVPGLPVYQGRGCPHCPYICRALAGLQDHRARKHKDQDGYWGQGKLSAARAQARAQARLADRVVSCQRFYRAGPGSHFFEVTCAAQPSQQALLAAPQTPAERIRAHIDQALREAEAAATLVNGQVPSLEGHPTEVSPWLELTRWPEYLRGQDLTAVALLGCPADPVQEPLLALFSASIERLIWQAYQTIRSGQINEFDQVQINTFFREPGVWNRPIQIHLRLKTYRQYCQVWQRLVCFAYRSTRPDQPIQLRHQLNTTQLAALDQMEEYGQQFLALRAKGPETQLALEASQIPQESGASGAPLLAPPAPPAPPAPRGPAEPLGPPALPAPPSLSPPEEKAQNQLDQACLTLSIALLDHTLKGDLFESTLVAFLAVLGVDPARQTFREPYSYTSYLSGLVKIAQMLVALQAVHLTRAGAVSHPADALDEMRERFLLYGVRAPFGWITRLRTYGKKIQNSTTSLGYIYWSDDEQTLSYKDLRLSMRGLRQFIAGQVQLAQADLARLFLLHEEEIREEIVPQLALHKLQDDPTKNQRGWNFLQDQRTRAALPTTGERWLLDRVLGTDWLREEFLQLHQIGQQDQVLWQAGAVDQYLQQVKVFLERLLLLVHMTGGQPARATELLSLRHSNTLHGRHRNIFIEHGLVSTVTTYHKGYSINNTTKIIHRYLPKAVSELVVYYLWLILPFCQALQKLVYGQKGPASAFLWPAGEGSWDSSQLRKVLQREARTHLQTKMNILSYRHAAIAISRVHLKCGGFKRDYGADDAAFNEQASHGSWIAGTVYARGLQEAPGHVEARRRQYRAISREWHGFLGFETYLGPRKRPAQDDLRVGQPKQQCIMVEMDYD